MYFNVIVIVIISLSITICNYYFLVVEIIKFWSLSKFDGYNKILLSIFPILCIKSLGLKQKQKQKTFNQSISL